MKAIDTTYRNSRFRSRVEARWAVFFDAMGIVWEYEKEGFVLDDGQRYLPDFWLPQVGMWAEVKGQDFTAEEVAKCVELAEGCERPVLMLNGQPDGRNFWAATPWDEYCPFTDYLFSAERYWETESRLFASTGEQYPSQSIYCRDCHGVRAAASARFEHGESGGRNA